MKQAQIGDRITIHYIGTLDNGRIFHQADEDSPMVATLGNDEMFPRMEEQILGMSIGEVRNVHLCVTEAYGPRKPENMIEVQRTLFPADRTLTIGQKLSIEIGGGSARVMRVREIKADSVVLDGNHDLAGCDLTFALKLASLERPTAS